MVYIQPLPGNLIPVTPRSFRSVNMFFTIWKKFGENLSIEFVLIYLTQTSLKGLCREQKFIVTINCLHQFTDDLRIK